MAASCGALRVTKISTVSAPFEQYCRHADAESKPSLSVNYRLVNAYTSVSNCTTRVSLAGAPPSTAPRAERVRRLAS